MILKVKKRFTIRHGLSHHKLYDRWFGQRSRCNNPNNKRYKSYGGRGIKFSKEFDDFSVWLKYVESLPNAYKEEYTIDRINNDGDYKRGNLRWVPRIVQAQNRKTLQKNNTVGYRGVYQYHNKGEWRARIAVNKKRIHLGIFKTKEEAARAYDTYVIKNKLNHSLN